MLELKKFNNWYEKKKIKSLEGFNGRFEPTFIRHKGGQIVREYTKVMKGKNSRPRILDTAKLPSKSEHKDIPS